MEADLIESRLEDVQNANHKKLTKWELDFIDSIADQYNEQGSLTDKQCELLNTIWDKI